MAEMTIANENDVAEMKAKSPINENQTLNDNGNDHDKALSKQNEFETSGDVGTVEGHSVEAMLKTFVTRPPDENDLT